MGNEIFGHSFTNSSDPNWVPEPGTRGTFSILSVCLVTLGLCVWTAIHLNVPEHNEPGWKQLMRKIGWLMLSLLSPELIAYTAYRQYVQARSIMNVMNEETERPLGSKLLRMWTHIRGFITSWGSSQRRPTDEEAPGSTARRWTIVHGFLAVMGGIAIEMNNDELQIASSDRIGNYFPMKESTEIHWQHGRPTLRRSQWQRSRLTLTLDGLRFLKEKAYDGLIPNLSEERIRDKSKGSAMAKTLVCIQASWFCVQCLTRFAQGLAISLLELNTLGHAICTLFIYALWWNKPLDIVEPETVLIHPSMKHDELEMAKLIAVMCSTSRLNKKAAESDHLHFNCKVFAFPVHCGTKYGSDCHVDLSGLPPGKHLHDSLLLNLTHSFYNEWKRLIVAPIRQIVLRAVKNPGLYLRVEESSALLEMVRLCLGEEHVVTLAGSDNKRDRDWSAIKLLSEEKLCSASNSQDSSPNYKSRTEMPRVVIQYSDIIRWQLFIGLGGHGLWTPPKDSFTDRIRNLPRF